MGILDAPIEIITLIMECLDLDDVFNLSLTCRQFSHLLRSQGLSRVVLKKAQHSLEFAEAEATGNYARGLRRLVKRRCAVRSAKPFHVAIMAVANDFIYSNGALCYTVNHEGNEYLRVLILRGCVASELEVNARLLLLAALPAMTRLSKYKFRPLHFADNVMSCLFSFTKDGAHSSTLVVWDVRSKEVLSAHPLASTKGLFVRNDGRHLYYGTRSGHGRDGSWRWLIRGLDLQTRSWSDKFVLHDLIGTSIGRTVCFEIFDGFFYGLSTQALVFTDETKSNSFYHAFRFRLGQHASMQVLPKSQTWRRQASEGSVDNRWTQLSLSKDEGTGQIYIYESRKEFLSTCSQSQRTCYKKGLSFPHLEDRSYCDPEPDPEDWNGELYTEDRDAENLHSGDNGSRGITFTYNNAPVRAYNPSCQSFMDLVNDPDPAGSENGAGSNTSCLRLRIRPNEPAAASQATQNLLHEQHDTSAAVPAPDQGVNYWPPRNSSDGVHSQLLNRIMNPQPLGEGVDWAADERLLIYSPRGTTKGQHRGLVLVSFDPGLHLYGLSKYHGGHAGDHHQYVASPTASRGKAECQTCRNDATADVGSTHKDDSGTKSLSQDTKYAATTDSSAVRLEADLATCVRSSRAYYLAIQGCDGAPYGLDMTQ